MFVYWEKKLMGKKIYRFFGGFLDIFWIVVIFCRIRIV